MKKISCRNNVCDSSSVSVAAQKSLKSGAWKIAAVIACAIISLVSFSVAAKVYAADGNLSVSGVSVTISGQKTQIAIVNPEKVTEDVSNGMLHDSVVEINKDIDNAICLYTADFYYPTTKRDGATEYQVSLVKGEYKITAKTNGNSYIPVGGFVLSYPSAAPEYAVGTKVTLDAPDGFSVPTMAVECEKTGQRVAVDAMNSTRSRPMVDYFDYQYGSMTGTNQYGTEMVATYDEEKGVFSVVRFRAFGEGSQSGIPIPDASFILSGYGTPYRGYFIEGKKFNKGDELTLINIDFIRTSTEVTWKYDCVNPTKTTNPSGMETENAEFPAFRGTDQTIIYKYGWSYKDFSGTGTNVYGYEAAVDESGTVIEKNVNVSTIPEGGFVMSGHGKGRDFIQANVSLGSKVVLNESTKTVTVITTLNSYYQLALAEFAAAKTAAATAVKMLYDVDEVALETKITEAEKKFAQLKTIIDLINQNDADDGWESQRVRSNTLMEYNKLLGECSAASNDISCSSIESKTVSARAMWHRPNIVGTETNLEGVIATLKTMKDCNINLVFVETFWGGTSMFKSEYVEYNKSFVNYSYGSYPDYLTAFSTEAEKMGIEVHAWVENFFVGLSQDIKILKDHPDWVLYNDDGSVLQRKEGGKYVFLDPSNPEVQSFLTSYYQEMLEKLPAVKGINLDYIRYPVSPAELDTGYTRYAMLDFAKSIGATLADNADLTKLRNNFKKLFNPNYNLDYKDKLAKWNEYRQNKVTSFVAELTTALKNDRKDLIISTAVFASVTEAKDTKMQDWPTWIRKGYIDLATPMAYYDSALQVMQKVSDMINITGYGCYNYAGIAPSYRGFPAYESSNHASGAFAGGSTGYVIFASQNFLPESEVRVYLYAGVNSKSAVLPHASLSSVLTAVFDGIMDKADRIYIPKNTMNAAKKDLLKAKFDALKKMPVSTSDEIEALATAVDELSEYDLSTYAQGYGKARIAEELQYLYGIIETHAERASASGSTGVDSSSSSSHDSTNSSTQSGTESSSGSGNSIFNCKNGMQSDVLIFAVFALAAAALLVIIRSRYSKK